MNDIMLLDLERQLRDDPRGEIRNQILARLHKSEGTVAKRLSQGVEKAEFDRLSKWQAALRAAIKVVSPKFE